MPATILTVQTVLGKYPSVPLVAASANIVFTAADIANGNRFQGTGREILLVRNVNVATPRTVTITSVNDPYNRRGDITAYSILGDTGATWAAFGPLKTIGWRNSAGYVEMTASAVDIQYAVLRLPSLF